MATTGSLVFNFSEAVQVGSGVLVLRPEPTGSVATAPISENQFSFNGVVLSLSPTSLESGVAGLGAVRSRDGVRLG